MPSISYAVKTLSWFLKRPALYPELARRSLQIIRGRDWHDSNKERSRADNWCEENAATVQEVLNSLFETTELKDLKNLYPEIVKFATERAGQTPVKMGGGTDIDFLYTLAQHSNARKVLETGVAFGWSTLALLLAINEQANSHLVSVDMPYPSRENDLYVGGVVPNQLRKNWTLLRLADREGLPKALKTLGSVDLAHYDSDKSYAGRMWSYAKIWEHLRPGGLLISDDIRDNFAFRDFAESVYLAPLIAKTSGRYIGVLRKQMLN